MGVDVGSGHKDKNKEFGHESQGKLGVRKGRMKGHKNEDEWETKV